MIKYTGSPNIKRSQGIDKVAWDTSPTQTESYCNAFTLLLFLLTININPVWGCGRTNMDGTKKCTLHVKECRIITHYYIGLKLRCMDTRKGPKMGRLSRWGQHIKIDKQITRHIRNLTQNINNSLHTLARTAYRLERYCAEQKVGCGRSWFTSLRKDSCELRGGGRSQQHSDTTESQLPN